MSSSSIWPIDKPQSSASTLGPSEPESDSNERVLRIFRSSSIREASPSYYVHFRANTLGKGMNLLILPPAMGK